jgi:acyl carrier protein
MDPIVESVRTFIIDRFLPSANPSELTATTPLLSSGIIDSLATVQLVAHLEETYGITLAPHEATTDYLDTLEAIATLVRSRVG